MKILNKVKNLSAEEVRFIGFAIIGLTSLVLLTVVIVSQA